MPTKWTDADPERLVNAVDDLIEAALMESVEEADAYLRDQGLDPDAIGRQFEELAREAIAARETLIGKRK